VIPLVAPLHAALHGAARRVPPPGCQAVRVTRQFFGILEFYFSKFLTISAAFFSERQIHA